MKNWYYLTTYGLCSLNCSGVYVVHYHTKNSGGKMNSRFNIITAVTYRIECILKTVFEFMLSQMTKPKSNLCNIFDYIIDLNRIMAIKIRIRRRPYEF